MGNGITNLERWLIQSWSMHNKLKTKALKPLQKKAIRYRMWITMIQNKKK